MVIFAYLLGTLLFLLDIIYVFVDPRIHLIPASNTTRTNARVKKKSTGWKLNPKAWMKSKSPGLTKPAAGPDMKRSFSWSAYLRDSRESMREVQARSRLFIQELRTYPSAIFGLIVITILLAGSLYAVIALPYEQFGQEYDQNRVQGTNLAPSLAAPSWFNYFSRTPRLSTLIMDETGREVSVSTKTLDNGWVEKTTTDRKSVV